MLEREVVKRGCRPLGALKGRFKGREIRFVPQTGQKLMKNGVKPSYKGFKPLNRGREIVIAPPVLILDPKFRLRFKESDSSAKQALHRIYILRYVFRCIFDIVASPNQLFQILKDFPMHPFFKNIHDHVSARHAAHHERHAARHAAHHAIGGRGFGGFRFDFGGGFPGEGKGGGRGGMGPGRKLGSADLQLLILALLAEKPRHGYEIIKALDERSNGFYSPSPGMVYPALTYLEEIGYATVAAEGAKKLYSITETG
ncbi:MAG: PadR family transcriptional regulator, partial [Pseudomonadota bacterium]